jgi:glycosyltransferase involved in cell wall biosynthesis
VDTKPKNGGKIRLVWIGSKSTLKYLAEIKPALEEIGSRFDNAILRIICDDFFDLQNMEVEKHQWSEETQVIDLATSDFGLAPLPDNRFTRGKCGFKILQYAAAELPVIASPVGVNAEYVCDGVTGFHAINTSQWVDKISELIENAELRKRMGREGRAKVKNFDIDVLGKRLLDLIVRALQNDECSG